MHHYIDCIIVDIKFVRSFKGCLAEEFDYADLFFIEIVSFESLNQILCYHVYQVLDHIFRVEEDSVTID
jgi:hypothetical protein